MTLFPLFNFGKKTQKRNTPSYELLEFGKYKRREITFDVAYEYYNQASTLAFIVDNISQDASQIGLLPENFEFDSKILRSLTKDMLLTGNGFLLLQGNINKLPVGYQFVPAINVEYKQISNTIEVKFEDKTIEFFYEPIRKRWLANELLELAHFLATDIVDGIFGNSPLQSLSAMLDTKIQLDNANANLIIKGFSGKGILSFDNTPTDSQKSDVEKSWASNYNGADNAGSIVMLTGGKASFVDLTTGVRDMDYQQLNQIIDEATLNKYRYPLPLAMTENMTFSNYSTGHAQYYENCVLPALDNTVGELNNVLRKRGLKQPLEINKERDNLPPSLSSKIFAVMSEAKLSAVLTPNEIRAIGGYEPLEFGGDIIGGKLMGDSNDILESLDLANSQVQNQNNSTDSQENND